MISLLFFVFFLSKINCDEELRALQPSTLVAQYPPNGTIPESPALFGSPPMGQSLTAQVVWATPGDLDGCQPINKSLNPNWPVSPSAAIVMVDRGACTFVTKVRNVQNAGGQAAIVVDNQNESILPYMADDGTGSDIAIPSVLIRLADGQNIKNALSQGKIVLMKMTWNIPNPDGRVEWRLWTSSNDQASVSFKQVFGTAVRALGSAAQFEPHYVIIDGTEAGCTAPSFPCGNQCTNQGRYCAADPDGDPSTGLNGADVVTENLREICIFKVLNSSGTPEVWWDYVSSYSKCKTGGTDCSNSVMAQLHINSTAVGNCVTASGGLSSNNVNTLLEAELIQLGLDGVFYFPTMFINNVPYRGSLTCTEPINVNWCGPLQSICAGYAPGSLPCACTSDAGCDLCVKKDICGVCGGTNSTCVGCDGVLNSGAKYDLCGVCNGNGSFDACHRCYQPNDPQRVDNGNYDYCGVCLPYGSPKWNKTCAGCDGQPYSPPCKGSSSSISTGGAIAIVLVCLAVIGVGVYFAFRSYKNKMEKHIDLLLRQYQPLDKKEKLLDAQSDEETGVDHERAPLSPIPASESVNS
jgi:hypothetical protein